MAAVAGRRTQVLFGGYDVSGYLDSADFSYDVDTDDTTTFSQSSSGRTHAPTLYTATLSTTGKWDPAQETLMTAVLATDASVLTYCPGGGTAQGDRARFMPVTVATYSDSEPVDGVVLFAWDLMAEGAVGLGVLLHPLAEDTNDTNGTTYDGTAATTTGARAALHVTAVDGGSWVIKVQHATASNFSDGADVTGLAFTAATGATAEIVSTAAGATLNRYIRTVATRTGGAGGDGITFSVAIARHIS